MKKLFNWVLDKIILTFLFGCIIVLLLLLVVGFVILAVAALTYSPLSTGLTLGVFCIGYATRRYFDIDGRP